MANQRAYHHGSLERWILDPAVTKIEQVRLEALSLRELANAVGVSRGAPYRHFPNRLSFLEMVTTRGLVMNGQLAQAVSFFSHAIVTFRGFLRDQSFYGGMRGNPLIGFLVPQLFNFERVEVL